MSALRRIARAAAALLSGDAVARVLLFVTTVYVARVLGPAAFGLVAFAQALLGYFLLASDWGLSTYGVREVANRPPRGRDIWLAITGVRAAVAVGLVLAAAAVLPHVRLDPRARVVVILTLLSAVPVAAVPDWVARGFGRMKAAAWLAVVQPAVALVAILALVHGPDSVEMVPLSRLVAALLTAAAGSAFLALRLRGPRPAPRAWLREHGTGRLLASGGVLLLANAAVLAYNSADQLLLKIYRGDQVVGLYGGAYRVIQLPMAALYAVTASALPVLTSLAREGAREARSTVLRLTILAGAAGLAIAAGLWLLRAPLVRMIYGEAFAEAAGVLGILAFAVPLDFVVSVKGTAYIAAGRERGALACVALAAATNITANLIWIPRFGMTAAAWVTLASYGVLLAAYALFMDTRRT